ncbi:MAG: O-antigen/teichoic acid export membrane protein [Cyclobacteriaceae bacterium]|jgi:O-antigen/teichoic acid export membrane protein
MGIVIRQSFWNSVWSYLGVGIGFINTLILRPAFFTESEIGIVSVVTSNALMLAPFLTLGMPNTYMRVFPELREQPQLESKILSLQFVLILIANLIFSVIVFFTIDWIKAIYIDESPEYNQYIFVSLLIMILFSLFMQMHAFSRSKLNVIIPAFLKEAFLRLGNVVLILLFMWKYITFSEMIYYLILSYFVACVILAIYIFKEQKIRLSADIFSIPREWLQKLYKYGSFNLMMAGCNSIYANIGSAMIPAILGAAANGVFSICLYIGIIIEMPKRSMLQIITPILGKEFQNNNLKEVDNLYKKASLSLGVIGLLFFIGVVCNLRDLFSLIPNGETYSTGFYVVVWIALAKIIDMLFSFNSELIYYTKYYKYNLYFFLTISVIIISLNYYLIPEMGIDGAAISFIISTILFNGIKFIFIKMKFGMIPFTTKHIPLFMFALITFGIFWYLPISDSALFNIIVRSIAITVVFMSLVYMAGISDDINRLIKTNFKKYLNIHLP